MNEWEYFMVIARNIIMKAFNTYIQTTFENKNDGKFELQLVHFNSLDPDKFDCTAKETYKFIIMWK
jgi:hypothetical protein